MSRAINNSFKDEIKEIIVHTGQHYDNNMSDLFFDELGIPKPDYNLHIGSKSHGLQTARMIEGLEPLLLDESPDYVMLYGDTNSTLAGAVAAAKLLIPVVHIEAGLRSFNKSMPEEINRIVCDHCATLLFSPTKTGYDNLIREGFEPANKMPFTADKPGIYHCGDVMYDNTKYFSKLADKRSRLLDVLGLRSGKFILCTVHRNNNTDIPERMHSIFEAILHIATQGELPVVMPLHPRTAKMMKKNIDKSLLRQIENKDSIKIVPAVSFLDMLALEKHTQMIITDSGGVQKEAYFNHKPCLILRPETEWTEIVDAGAAILTDADKERILKGWQQFVDNPPKEFPSIFGDGQAAEFICKELVKNVNEAKPA